jgi:hypothetical protein
MNQVLNSIPNNLFIYYHTPSNLLLHLPPVISSICHCYCCMSFQLKVSFDISSPDPYLELFSHLYCMFLFLFELLIFTVKLKYTNNSVYCSYCRDDYLVDQCVSWRSNLEHFNRRWFRYSCRVHIFYQRENQYS